MSWLDRDYLDPIRKRLGVRQSPMARRKQVVKRKPRKAYANLQQTPLYQSRVVAQKPSAFSRSAQSAVGKFAGSALGSAATKGAGAFLGSQLMKTLATGAGTAIGGVLGGPFGAALGSTLGRGVATLGEWISGRGDYSLNGNSVLDGGMSPPQIINVHENHGIIVRHREYLGDINATTAFTIQNFVLNPGISQTFPWLAQIAGSYDEYRMRGLVFEFKSLSSDAVLSASTSSALGSVIMATQYNPLNPAFANKQQMENYEFANSSKPSCSFMHPVECDPKQTVLDGKLFTRIGAVPTGADQRLYDMGTFSIATVGMQAASGVCGELWCTYEVEFWKAKFNTVDVGGQAGLNDHFTLATVSNANPMGTASTNSVNATLKGTIVSGGTYSFPSFITEGSYLFVYEVVGTAAAITSPSITVSGGNIINAWNGNAVPFISIPNNGVATSTRFCQCWVVTVAISGCTVALGAAGSLPTAITTGDLYVTAIEAV